MRSSLPIPALAILALALAACEVQPVVSNITPPPAVQAETPATEITVTETNLAETGFETGGEDDVTETASAAAPEIAPEAEPETASQETDTVADTAAEQDAPAAETAESSQPDPAEPETAPAIPPAIPAATAEDTVELADAVQSEAGGQAEQELPQTGDLAMVAPPPPPPPELAPSSLVGISIPMLQSRLGDADFTRTEGEVETWQYRFETCVVDYFLVVDSEAARVVSWAWRAPVIDAQIDETACRRALAGRDTAS